MSVMVNMALAPLVLVLGPPVTIFLAALSLNQFKLMYTGTLI